MDKWLIAHSVDLDTGQITITNGCGISKAVRGNAKSIVWQVTALKSGSAADISGCSCSCNVLRSDGTTVPVSGSVSGNACSITFTSQCFAVTGKIQCFMNLVDASGDTIMTVSGLQIDVLNGETNVIDPGDEFPDLSFVISQMLWTSVTVTGVMTITRDNEGHVTVTYLDDSTYSLSYAGDTLTIT